MMKFPETGCGRRSVLAAIASGGVVAAAGCLGGGGGPDASADSDAAEDEPSFPDHPGDEPRDPPAGRRCDGPCGMEPRDYPEANAQVAHVDGSGVFFDSAGCLVSYLHDPMFYGGPAAAVETVWVRDFGTKALIDATEAGYVLDYSKERHEEVMAHNPKPFADRADAIAYVDSYDDLGEADIVGLDDFGAKQAHRYRDYPLPEE
ncbi:MAG: copper chaperone NosL [Natronomonas sp.]|jgi:nitrous oxide reductase accessory protein NosL